MPERSSSPHWSPQTVVGRRSEGSVEWTPDDVMLYALGVAAGQAEPVADLELTTENSEGRPLRVIPTFGALLTQRQLAVAVEGAGARTVVHAEQWLRVSGPIPASGTAIVQAEVTSVQDKRSGAMVVAEGRADDGESGERLIESRSSFFVVGEGGFGGADVTPPVEWSAPARAPDRTLRCPVRADQALIYRLTGDRNPLHSDPCAALAAGFPGPILHGLATFGIAGRLLFEEYCDRDPARFSAIGARFTAPFVAGSSLLLDCWDEPAGALFRARTEEGTIILDRGRFAHTGLGERPVAA